MRVCELMSRSIVNPNAQNNTNNAFEIIPNDIWQAIILPSLSCLDRRRLALSSSSAARLVREYHTTHKQAPLKYTYVTPCTLRNFIKCLLWFVLGGMVVGLSYTARHDLTEFNSVESSHILLKNVT